MNTSVLNFSVIDWTRISWVRGEVFGTKKFQGFQHFVWKMVRYHLRTNQNLSKIFRVLPLSEICRIFKATPKINTMQRVVLVCLRKFFLYARLVFQKFQMLTFLSYLSDYCLFYLFVYCIIYPSACCILSFLCKVYSCLVCKLWIPVCVFYLSVCFLFYLFVYRIFHLSECSMF